MSLAGGAKQWTIGCTASGSKLAGRGIDHGAALGVSLGVSLGVAQCMGAGLDLAHDVARCLLGRDSRAGVRRRGHGGREDGIQKWDEDFPLGADLAPVCSSAAT